MCTYICVYILSNLHRYILTKDAYMCIKCLNEWLLFKAQEDKHNYKTLAYCLSYNASYSMPCIARALLEQKGKGEGGWVCDVIFGRGHCHET
jgi:hypothetical protein